MLASKAKNADAGAGNELSDWFKATQRADWRSIEDVRAQFATADRVGRVLIFNIRRNAYRPMVRHEFPWNRLFVKVGLSHKEYDRKERIEWP